MSGRVDIAEELLAELESGPCASVALLDALAGRHDRNEVRSVLTSMAAAGTVLVSTRFVVHLPEGNVEDDTGVRDRALDACEDDGQCQHREGPDGWCDPCVAAHLPGW